MKNTPSSYTHRNEIPNRYKWDFTHIYQSPDKWEDDFENLSGMIGEYPSFMGRVMKNSKILEEVLNLEEKVGAILGRLYLYSFLNKDIDMSDNDSKVRFGRIQGLAADISAASAFIIPEIVAADSKVISEIKQNKRLKKYRHFLDDLQRKKKHTLTSEQEALISRFSPILSAPYNTFSLLKSTDIDFPTVNNNGEEIKLSDGKYTSLMYDKDNELREKAYREYYKPYISHKNTIASLLDSALKGIHINSVARGYGSSLESSLYTNNIPVDFFRQCLTVSKENSDLLRRWAVIKSKQLDKTKVSPFDTYVSLFNPENIRYDYEASIKLVTEALLPLGNQYLLDVKSAIDNRRIDVYETKGKRSGAYSSGTTYGVVPYVLLNWNNTLNDVFTFAHELGHNMHSLYTGNNQPYVYAGYSIFLAEVASITNESLLQRYLEEKTSSIEDKLYLHELFLNKCMTTYYRQLQFADFEHKIHSRVGEGIPLTPDYLCQQYSETFKDYWGDSVILEEEEKYSWTRIPHFYYNFYVYQYATGLVAGEWLAEKVYSGSEEALDNYLSFLRAGKSDYPMQILSKAGCDLTEGAPFQNLFNKMKNSLDFIEEHL